VDGKALRTEAVHVLRRLRNVALAAARPVDELALTINGKRHYPPIGLRRYVGPLRSFETSGAEFTAYLKLLGHLEPTSRLLDIGCGCGLIALQLDGWFTDGGYWGVDIHEPSIEWASREIAAAHPEFRFQHIDVRSEAYNRYGAESGSGYRFPFEDRFFDVILLKSVFTHMRPPDVDNYVGEIARLLRPGGRCLLTFFLLNEEQRRRERENRLAFTHGDGTWRYVHEESPETAVAYDERFVLDLFDRHGLRLAEAISYGRWSGRPDGLTFQDLLVVTCA
jgi:SAM-dependent methyltransferase